MESERIRILFQDEDVAVCIKPAGVDSERGMCDLLSAQTGQTALCVHRLDRTVGGVMVYALSAASSAALSKAITEGALEKTYLAVCEGVPEPPEGEMRDLLFHDSAKNKTYVVQRQRRGVREALLTYETLAQSDSFSLVRIHLVTGRSHQIRVQFASRGRPLAGDRKYGAKTRCCLALWSPCLSFPHPHGGAPLQFCVPPPDTPPWTEFDTEKAR